MTDKTPNGLDLDALEAEDSPVEPYIFTLGGKQYTVKDPERVDWQVVIDLDTDDPRAVMSAYLGADEFAEFAKNKLSSKNIGALMEDIERHFHLGEESASPA